MNEYLSAYNQSRHVSDWLKDPICKVGREALRMRLKRGWPAETALSKPVPRKLKLGLRSAVSPYRGVCWHRVKCRWVARIWHERTGRTIGYFRDEVAAARAYDREARRLKGVEAITNFPE